jgi:competence protein ComEA
MKQLGRDSSDKPRRIASIGEPMDEHAPWRALEAEPSRSADADGSDRTRQPGGWLALAAAAAIALGALAVIGLAATRGGGQVELVSTPPSTEGAHAATSSQSVVVVQVAGAVLRPGVYTLPAGSRVGDAIALAGGYSADVDPRLAETTINLAARLTDSQLVLVPRRDDGLGASAGATVAPAHRGLVDLNTANAAELDTLPGVGPATAAKIIAAREEALFTSIDDLVTRKVVSASVLAKFRDLVTV